MIADEFNINECTAHQIVTQDLNMRKVCAKMVPKKLNDDQKAVKTKLRQKCLKGSKLNNIFLIWSTYVTKVVFLEYYPETRGRVRNGTRQNLQDRSWTDPD
jgi:hypothetical protein